MQGLVSSRSDRIARQQQPQRQTDPGFQAAAAAIAQLDAAAVQGGDALDDGQAESGTLAAAGTVAADEGIENAAQLGWIETGPAVEHAEHHAGRAALAGYRHGDFDRTAAITQGALDQVDQIG